jgi:hypothetical protein
MLLLLLSTFFFLFVRIQPLGHPVHINNQSDWHGRLPARPAGWDLCDCLALNRALFIFRHLTYRLLFLCGWHWRDPPPITIIIIVVIIIIMGGVRKRNAFTIPTIVAECASRAANPPLLQQHWGKKLSTSDRRAETIHSFPACNGVIDVSPPVLVHTAAHF